MPKLSPTRVLFISVSLMFILGLVISRDYGYTTDEDSERTRAKIALSHYGIPNDSRQKSYDQIHHKKYYGTAISMVGVLTDELLAPVLGTPLNAVWHAVNFVFFLAGVVGIYYLARLFVSDGIALFASFLYASQPLYFGHAFMNPKDMPLQAMFILTVTLGFYIERHPDWQRHIQRPYNLKIQLAFWRSLILSWRLPLRWVNAIAFLLLVALVLLKGPLTTFAARVFAYTLAHPGWLPGRIVWAFAGFFETDPAVITVQELTGYYQRVYPLQIIALALYLAGVLFITYRRQPSLRENSPVLRYSDNLTLLAAGAVFGIALSTRLIAFAAGGLVGLYYFWSYRRRAVPPMILYSITAFAAHYLTWPLYWESSIFTVLRESFSLLLYFDPLSGVGVPFEGQMYRADSLPNHYTIKLIALQFTLPLLLLALLGIALWLLFRYRERASTSVFRKERLVLLWFLLPAAFVTLNPPVMYNSFRQFLFITPPLVIFASIAIERLKAYLPRAALIGVMALSLLPGVIAIFSLHPYQYIYYNAFAGGTKGAYETYDLDYWYLGISEAMDYLNQVAEPNAKVFVTYGADDHARLYQRPDLKIPNEDRFANVSAQAGYRYALISTENWQHQDVPPGWQVLHTVEAGGAPLFFIYTVE